MQRGISGCAALDRTAAAGPPAVYSTLRNSIEGMNGYIKDGAHEALDDPERRRIRGVAAQSVFVAFLLFAANLRKIFLINEAAVVEGQVRQLPRRRRSRALGHWSPDSSADGLVREPDTPLIV